MFKRRSQSVLTLSERVGMHVAGTVALLAIAGLTWSLILRPVQTQIAERERAAKPMKLLAENHRQLTLTKSRLVSQVEKERERLEQLRGMLTGATGIEEHLTALQDAADQSQVVIASIRPLGEQVRKICRVQEFVVTTSCHHASLCQFLDNLTRHEQPIFIAEMHVQPTGTRHRNIDSQQLAVTLHIQFPVRLKESWRKQIDHLLQEDR